VASVTFTSKAGLHVEIAVRDRTHPGLLLRESEDAQVSSY
jgi:hypothetical protein